MADLVQVTQSLDDEADRLIEQYFTQHDIRKDVADFDEKKIIIKELALASKRSEIIKRLNERRAELGIPQLQDKFDVGYYQAQFAPLLETLSLHYANNIAKKFRFANRIARIARLNDIAESTLDRIEGRTGITMGDKEERVHNENIKVLVQLFNAIGDSVGNIKITKIDVGVHSTDKPLIQNPEDVQKLIVDALRTRFHAQLPEAVEANFTPFTDHDKCEFGEKLGEITHCWYHNEQCKVQTGEVALCPFFLNKVVLRNKEYMTRRYNDDKMGVRQIAELAGCKEPTEGVIERVRNRLNDFGLYGQRNTGRTDKPVVPTVPAGEVEN